jgi:hypothetical protein
MDNPFVYVLPLVTVVIACIRWCIRTRRAGHSRVDDEIIARWLAPAFGSESAPADAAVQARPATADVQQAEPWRAIAHRHEVLGPSHLAVARPSRPRILVFAIFLFVLHTLSNLFWPLVLTDLVGEDASIPDMVLAAGLGVAGRLRSWVCGRAVAGACAWQ